MDAIILNVAGLQSPGPVMALHQQEARETT